MSKCKKNVLGQHLVACCYQPLTGYFRDGYCHTDKRDFGKHIICAEVTTEFLGFSKKFGNDLSISRLEYGFFGLKPNDRWCLCALHWKDAYEANVAPTVILEACEETEIKIIYLEVLLQYSNRLVH